MNFIARHYSKTLKIHGETHRGVGWATKEDQIKRFELLTKLLPNKKYSLNDYGCGYGALLDYLAAIGKLPIDYNGYDVCPGMMAAALRRRLKFNIPGICLSGDFQVLADFSVSSGMFNLPEDGGAWRCIIKQQIAKMCLNSRFGFGFNLLRKPREDGLYASEPQRWLKFCSGMGKCELLEIPGDFTILVRKRT